MPGPESALVERFVEDRFWSSPRNCQITLFREPKVATAFPDLVSVTWHARRMKNRCHDTALSKTALRLLHFLTLHGPTQDHVVERYFPRGRRILADLHASGVVYRRLGWRVRRGVFVVRHIAAFEAKVGGWERVLAQAVHNLWFATQSYALVEKVPSNAQLRDACSLGVGVWIIGQPTPVVPADLNADQPVSYASWQFNEWVWRDAWSS